MRHGLLYEPGRYPDVKDPSPVFDGARWHLFGTGCGVPRGLEILHLTAPSLAGPWREEAPPILRGVDHVPFPCAPGVVADGRRLHLFLHHDFNVLGGRIEHLISSDGGASFECRGPALRSNIAVGEGGVYDPDAAVIGGRRYLTYAAMTVVGQPDIYLARSRTRSWNGPWERLGCILDHARVACHNQLDDPCYEWGLEGPHLLPLAASGAVLLTAVCFLPDRPVGHRQRLLLAVAEQPGGPYTVLGPVIEPSGPDGQGENGHGTAVLSGGLVHLIYQERAGDGLPWRYMRATVDPADLLAALRGEPVPAAVAPAGDAPAGAPQTYEGAA